MYKISILLQSFCNKSVLNGKLQFLSVSYEYNRMALQPTEGLTNEKVQTVIYKKFQIFWVYSIEV